jgi:hypothetical protein
MYLNDFNYVKEELNQIFDLYLNVNISLRIINIALKAYVNYIDSNMDVNVLSKEIMSLKHKTPRAQDLSNHTGSTGVTGTQSKQTMIRPIGEDVGCQQLNYDG